jgi:hypothetical protein
VHRIHAPRTTYFLFSAAVAALAFALANALDALADITCFLGIFSYLPAYLTSISVSPYPKQGD